MAWQATLFTPGEWLALLAAAVLAPFAVYALKIARAAREGIRWKLRVLAKTVAAYALVVFAMAALGRPPLEAVLAGMIVGVVAGNRVPRRSRRIPTRVRRNVIARFEAETGRKFDSRKHHLDHVVPFARGGSHAEDNLRVIEKRKNLKKGKRMPRYEDFPV